MYMPALAHEKTADVDGRARGKLTGWFREIETTVFDPASVFLSTH